MPPDVAGTILKARNTMMSRQTGLSSPRVPLLEEEDEELNKKHTRLFWAGVSTVKKINPGDMTTSVMKK